MVTEYRALRLAALAFAIGFSIHGVDHFIRGFAPTPTPVVIAGNLQGLVVIAVVALVYRGHRLGPAGAIFIGLASSIGFSVAHLLPTFGWFSDSFVTPVANSGVTWFSWVTVFTEIGTALVFAYVGFRTLSRRKASAGRGRAAGSPVPTG